MTISAVTTVPTKKLVQQDVPRPVVGGHAMEGETSGDTTLRRVYCRLNMFETFCPEGHKRGYMCCISCRKRKKCQKRCARETNAKCPSKGSLMKYVFWRINGD